MWSVLNYRSIVKDLITSYPLRGEKFSKRHTFLTPYTRRKFRCHVPPIKGTSQEDRITFCPVSRLPLKGIILKIHNPDQISYASSKFRPEYSRNKSTLLEVTVSFGFISSTSRDKFSRSFIYDTQSSLLIPGKLRWYHSTIQSALHEKRSTFSDLSSPNSILEIASHPLPMF